MLLSDISNNKSFCIGTYSALGLVGLVMTLLNVATNKGFLTLCTAAFTILCIVNIILTLVGKFWQGVAKALFAIEVLCMFTFFLVSGNPDGFSAIWICMLPSIGMFFFNRHRGTLICIAMFAFLVFFLWVPYGQTLLQYDYTATFRMRFPVLFIAFHMLAYLLETLRENAYKEMKRLQDYYQDLSIRDQLTGLFNRQGMYYALEHDPHYRNAKSIGVAMFDIDHFKEVNDTHGHNMGDIVLKKFAKLIKLRFDSIVCRWGGEEFVVIFIDDGFNSKKFDLIKRIVGDQNFCANGETFHITTSIGISTASDINIKKIDDLIDQADKALYHAKNTGRNKIVYFEDLEPEEK